MTPETQPAEVVEQVPGKTRFGFGQIGQPTPLWAKWAFRIFFYLTSTVAVFLSVFTEIPTDAKLLIMKGVTFGNLAVHALSKMFGITEEVPGFYNERK